jgi:hypothetical protein
MFIYYNDKEIDCTISKNNVHINHSIKIKRRKEMTEIIDMIKQKLPEHEINNVSTFLCVQEWGVHNLLYSLGLYRDRTRDLDIDTNKPWYMKIIYYILGFLYM